MGGPGYGVPEEVVEAGVARPGAGYGYGPLPAPGGVAVGEIPSAWVWAGVIVEGITATDVLALVTDAVGFAGGDVEVIEGMAVERGVEIGSGV